MADDNVVSGLYASRDKNGSYRIVKVLVVDEYAVHLRSYTTRFKELPAQVRSPGRAGEPRRIRDRPLPVGARGLRPGGAGSGRLRVGGRRRAERVSHLGWDRPHRRVSADAARQVLHLVESPFVGVALVLG
ncbi:MAG: hypothetical protein ACRC8S_14835 [Fimbriiglobus sp.]